MENKNCLDIILLIFTMKLHRIWSAQSDDNNRWWWSLSMTQLKKICFVWHFFSLSHSLSPWFPWSIQQTKIKKWSLWQFNNVWYPFSLLVQHNQITTIYQLIRVFFCLNFFLFLSIQKKVTDFKQNKKKSGQHLLPYTRQQKKHNK